MTKRPPAPARRSSSIVGRLTVWYAGSAFGLILLATFVLYTALVSNLDREDDQFLTDTVHIVRAFLRDRPDDTAALKREVEWQWASRRYAQVFARIVDQNGTAVVETPGMSSLLPAAVFPSPAPIGRDISPGIEVATADQSSFRVVSARAEVGRDRAPRTIQVALNQAHEITLLADYRRKLGWVLGIAFVLCTVVGYQIARRAVRPVEEIVEAAKRVRSSTLDSRIDASSLPTELATPAETFNTMLQGLQQSFDRLSQFSADIAHELRTPVNNLRGEAEVALSKGRTPDEYREILGSILEEAQRLSRIIDGLLFLARAHTPDPGIVRERINVAHELAVVKEFYDGAAIDAGVSLAVSADDDLELDADRTLFQRAVGNLLSNALAHTPAGGSATIEAARVNDRHLVRIVVTDTGRGISPDHLPYVFDRFYRADPSRSSSSGGLGLGLPLVRSIMNLHDGFVDIESDSGRGTSVFLCFPLPSAGRTRPQHI